jgi:hypothetical protein
VLRFPALLCDASGSAFAARPSLTRFSNSFTFSLQLTALVRSRPRPRPFSLVRFGAPRTCQRRLSDLVDVSEPIATEQPTDQRAALQPSHYNTASAMTSHARGRGTARPAAVALARTLLLLAFAAAAAEAASQSHTPNHTHAHAHGAQTATSTMSSSSHSHRKGAHAQWASACIDSSPSGTATADRRVPSRAGACAFQPSCVGAAPPASCRTAAVEANDCLLTHDALCDRPLLATRPP